MGFSGQHRSKNRDENEKRYERDELVHAEFSLLFETVVYGQSSE
jgi:hypothetical protein